MFEDRGAPASELAVLRAALREAGLVARATPIRQLRRALVGTPYASLGDDWRGALIVVTIVRDPKGAARLAEGLERRCEHLRVYACLVPGARIDLAAMQELASRGDARVRLLATLAAGPRSLLALFDERVCTSGITVSLPDLYVAPLAEILALQRRLRDLLGELKRGLAGDAWRDAPLPDTVLAALPDLHVRAGWRLWARAYGSNCHRDGAVWALPANRRPGPDSERHEQPVLAVLAGDGSLASYLHASLLRREFAEFAAHWHAIAWSDHELVDVVPDGEPWQFTEQPPRRLTPRVIRRGDEILVVLWTVCRAGRARLERHVDYYRPGDWWPREHYTKIATGGPGWVR